MGPAYWKTNDARQKYVDDITRTADKIQMSKTPKEIETEIFQACRLKKDYCNKVTEYCQLIINHKKSGQSGVVLHLPAVTRPVKSVEQKPIKVEPVNDFKIKIEKDEFFVNSKVKVKVEEMQKVDTCGKMPLPELPKTRWSAAAEAFFNEHLSMHMNYEDVFPGYDSADSSSNGSLDSQSDPTWRGSAFGYSTRDEYNKAMYKKNCEPADPLDFEYYKRVAMLGHYVTPLRYKLSAGFDQSKECRSIYQIITYSHKVDLVHLKKVEECLKFMFPYVK